MRTLLTLFLVISVVPVAAAEWAIRDGDRILTREEVGDLTIGRTIVFHDDGESMYSAGGAYSYNYASGVSAFGRFSIAEDGTVCIAYRNGFGRCDRYVQGSDGIVLLTEKGLRFPVRQSREN
jgi:hypothetical protein